MNKEDYLNSYSKNKIDYIKNQKDFLNREMSNEKLFSKYLRSIDFLVEEIVPFNNEGSAGAVVYTPDFSAVNYFKKRSCWEKNAMNLYNNKEVHPEFQKDKIFFGSDIIVDNQEIENFRIELRNQEMKLNGYDVILKGVCSWEYGYDKKENESYIRQAEKRIDFFKKNGMDSKLIESVKRYFHSWAIGLDPDEEDPRR